MNGLSQKYGTKILNIHPNAELHIAGRNCDDNLQTQIKTFKNVIFYGEVPSSKEFLAAHSILIVPLFLVVVSELK